MAAGVVTSSSSSRVTFTVSSTGPPPIGLLSELTLRVGNRGHALMAMRDDAARRLAVVPVVSDITPYKGSLAGGTLVTLTGSGFAVNTADVTVGVWLCSVLFCAVYCKEICLEYPCISVSFFSISLHACVFQCISSSGSSTVVSLSVSTSVHLSDFLPLFLTPFLLTFLSLGMSVVS